MTNETIIFGGKVWGLLSAPLWMVPLEEGTDTQGRPGPSATGAGSESGPQTRPLHFPGSGPGGAVVRGPAPAAGGPGLSLLRTPLELPTRPQAGQGLVSRGALGRGGSVSSAK